jgi:hypothetical protein
MTKRGSNPCPLAPHPRIERIGHCRLQASLLFSSFLFSSLRCLPCWKDHCRPLLSIASAATRPADRSHRSRPCEVTRTIWNRIHDSSQHWWRTTAPRSPLAPAEGSGDTDCAPSAPTQPHVRPETPVVLLPQELDRQREWLGG